MLCVQQLRDKDRRIGELRRKLTAAQKEAKEMKEATKSKLESDETKAKALNKMQGDLAKNKLEVQRLKMVRGLATCPWPWTLSPEP